MNQEIIFHPENDGAICVIRDTALGAEALKILDWDYRAWCGCFTQLKAATI